MKNEKTNLIIWAVVALVIGVIIGMIITNATTGNATAVNAARKQTASLDYKDTASGVCTCGPGGPSCPCGMGCSTVSTYTNADGVEIAIPNSGMLSTCTQWTGTGNDAQPVIK